ncbi:hypothetical protein B0T18DRAFT_414833 [Schizothecium vesticola]|uniref:Uncharacterized protein n=1 Tax=Schizothecium vesticola TaxID=314040 RepID=A0AA40EPT4_9PEZI|nr:hypothetical protein B0T18DRAFT_414833 [Schizothecium vesticola]
MRQDPNLYGQPPPKKQKNEIPLSSSLAFTSQLSSLLATQTSTTTSSAKNTYASASSSAIPARSRPSKSKTTDLNSVKVKRKAGGGGGGGGHHDDARDSHNGKLVLKETHGTEDDAAARLHARRRMESKARLYAAMQRGDYVGREIGLVDFDRKWAEKGTTQGASDDHSSSDSDSDSDPNIDTEIIEYEDEFGRLRRGTRAEKVRQERRLARGEASAVELERMSARPREPQNLIVGDAVQAEAFVSRDDEAMEALARKRDRSASPPPAEHYRADKEIRTKGVGFYAFSQDEATREAEMASLEAERARTEELKREREEKAAARRRDIEARRREIGERRAKKLADSFLDGLGMQLGVVGGGGEENGMEGKDGEGK